MRIEIEIPKEFEEHFKQDKFEDSLHRLCADAHLIAGNYEQETAIMLIKAFKESKPAFDTEKVVEQLEEEREHSYADFCEYLINYELDNDFEVDDDWFYKGLIRAKQIVRKGGAE